MAIGAKVLPLVGYLRLSLNEVLFDAEEIPCGEEDVGGLGGPVGIIEDVFPFGGDGSPGRVADLFEEGGRAGGNEVVLGK
ncbi:hypothetical protein [Planctomicrobium piriforme]|uniref:hypothetical protein n=1 Tax=Planctomicrobium piriforme TaxID=1576369 RepID=UPI001113F91A|nr:hypothetical protein [Planctomicrobium piriforme]